MAERIDVPGDWQRVSTRYAVVDLVGTLIWGVIIAAAVTVPMYFAMVEEGLAGLAFGIGGAVLLLFVIMAIFAFLRVRTIGFLLRADDMLLRRGMMFRRFVSVPYGRMQVVDITQGPVERMFSLKTLKLVTAAATSALTVPGLEGERAEQLRDHLVSVAESRRAGL